MSIPPRMFPQTVTIQEPGGYDDYGRPIPGQKLTFQARINTTERIERGEQGTEILTRSRAYIPGSPVFDPDSTILLPGHKEFEPITYIKPVAGARDVEYTEVSV